MQEVADYGRVVNTFVSITTGSEGQVGGNSKRARMLLQHMPRANTKERVLCSQS